MPDRFVGAVSCGESWQRVARGNLSVLDGVHERTSGDSIHNEGQSVAYTGRLVMAPARIWEPRVLFNHPRAAPLRANGRRLLPGMARATFL